MTVLHLITNFYPVVGGLETFVLGLTFRLRQRGVDARVLCLNRAGRREPRLKEHAVVQDVPVHRVGFVDLTFYKPAILPMPDLRAADLLHVHGIGANLDFLTLMRHRHRKPIIVSTHGGIFHTSRLAMVKNLYFNQVARRSLNHVDRVVACSRQDMEMFAPVAPRMLLIENAVELPEPRAGNDWRDRRRCLFVGRFAANKRLDNLLRAFAAADPEKLDLQLRLVGPDWQHLGGELRSLAGRLQVADRVVFVGAVSRAELEEEYRSASLFLSASEHEGFGISLVEAMSAGAVPVVNDIAAFRNVVTDRNDGFLTDFADSIVAGTVIARVASSDLEPIRRSAIKRARDYSWDLQLPKWLDLYDRVLHGK